MVYYPLLEKEPIDQLFLLKEILVNFNRRFEEYFYLFDAHVDELDSGLIKLLMNARPYIFYQFKKDKLFEVVDKTRTDSRPEIFIDKTLAADAKAKGEFDETYSKMIFNQVSRALSTAPNKNLRSTDNMFKWAWKGESMQSDNSQFRILLDMITEELQSPCLNLLVKTQNSLLGVGPNRDLWMINPQATSEYDYEEYLSFGKLLGSSIRAKFAPNLELPLVFYKRLVYETPTFEDIKEIDYPLYKLLKQLRNPEEFNITPDNFSTIINQKFVYKVGGLETELCEDGANIEVTYDNARHYADLVEQKVLNQNPKAYEAIRKGMCAVLPVDRMNLLNGEQLRTALLIYPTIKIDILKANTQYDGCRDTDPHIQLFWQTVEGLGDTEKWIFYNYLTQRNRLNEWNLPTKYTIAKTSKTGPVNSLTPTVDVDNFRLELPAYTTAEVMREKLVYAMTHPSQDEIAPVEVKAEEAPQE